MIVGLYLHSFAHKNKAFEFYLYLEITCNSFKASLPYPNILPILTVGDDMLMWQAGCLLHYGDNTYISTISQWTTQSTIHYHTKLNV